MEYEADLRSSIFTEDGFCDTLQPLAKNFIVIDIYLFGRYKLHLI